MIKFNSKWLNEENFKDWLFKMSDYIGRCDVRNTDLKVGYTVRWVIDKHCISRSHIDQIEGKLSSKQLISVGYKVGATKSDEEKYWIAEICKVYNDVIHDHIYISIGCGTDVNKKIMMLSMIIFIFLLVVELMWTRKFWKIQR